MKTNKNLSSKAKDNAQLNVSELTGRDAALKLLEAVHGVGKKIHFQTFDDGKNKAKHLISTKYSSFLDALEHLKSFNKKGAGVFFCINSCSGSLRREVYVDGINAYFVDVDDDEANGKKGRVPNAEDIAFFDVIVGRDEAPTRWHGYKFAKDPLEIANYKEVQNHLIEHFKSDPAVKNPVHVLRVPGFDHLKGEPSLVKILHMKKDFQPMSGKEIIEMFPSEKLKAKKEGKTQKKVKKEKPKLDSSKGLNKDGNVEHNYSVKARIKRAKAYIKKCDPSICGQNGSEKLMSAIEKVYVGFDVPREDAHDVLHEWNTQGRAEDEWSRDELEHALDSADSECDEPRGFMLHRLEDKELENKLANVYCYPKGTNYSYWVYENGKFDPLPTAEFASRTNDSIGKNKERRTQILSEMRTQRQISEITSHVVTHGQSQVELIRQTDGKIKVVYCTSFLNILKDLAKEYEGVKIPKELEELFETQYKCMSDIFLAGLARRFTNSKKAFTWIHAPSDYGKNFFLDVKGLTRVFPHTYSAKDFRQTPDTYDKLLMFFIDEANKFTRAMKSDNLTFNVLYGPEASLRMPMRVLASANPIADLTGGLDDQLKNRVVQCSPSNGENLKEALKRIGINGTEKAKNQWNAYIIRKLKDQLDFWVDETILNENLTVEDLAEEAYENYLDNAKKLKSISLEQMVKDEIQEEFTDQLGFVQEEPGENGRKLELKTAHTPRNKSCLSEFMHFQEFDPKTNICTFAMTRPIEVKEWVSDRLGQKKFTMTRKFNDAQSFSNIFGEYKPQKIKVGGKAKSSRSVKFQLQLTLNKEKTEVESAVML